MPRIWVRPPTTRETVKSFLHLSASKMFPPGSSARACAPEIARFLSNLVQSPEHERDHLRAATFLRAGRLPFGRLGFQPGIGIDST